MLPEMCSPCRQQGQLYQQIRNLPYKLPLLEPLVGLLLRSEQRLNLVGRALTDQPPKPKGHSLPERSPLLPTFLGHFKLPKAQSLVLA